AAHASDAPPQAHTSRTKRMRPTTPITLWYAPGLKNDRSHTANRVQTRKVYLENSGGWCDVGYLRHASECPMPPRLAEPPRLDPRKFRDPRVTAKGETRAQVMLKDLRTLWFNTGTLCNLTCRNCYIESSPANDRLVYLTAAEIRSYLDEIRDGHLPTEEIGFTGGEPFMNPDLPAMITECLDRGFRVLVLTNAMKPMAKVADALLAARAHGAERLAIRVSIDHYTRDVHELERGGRTWAPVLAGLHWLVANGFEIHVAARNFTGQSEAEIRRGFAR